MLKIGVLGAGHLGKIHLKCIAQISKYQLVGFYDADEENAKKSRANAAWMASIALDQAGAMHETMRALELSPQDPSLLHSLAIQQTAFGQLEEAVPSKSSGMYLSKNRWWLLPPRRSI